MELWKLDKSERSERLGLGLRRLLEATLHFKANTQDLQPANLGAASFWNQISFEINLNVDKTSAVYWVL